jgi:transaldolase
MEFFLDTADVDDVHALIDTGFVDGITTNPTLIARSGRLWKDVIKEMCEVVDGPVSAEVSALDFDTMLAESRALSKINEKIAVKVPLTPNGLRVCKILSEEEIMVNVTLCFSANQALLAAKAGATFISPFIGRLDDTGHDGIHLIKEIRALYDTHPQYETLILAASIRHPLHVIQSAQAGADIATIHPKIIHQLYTHPLTDNGIESFVKDWSSTGQSIL